MNFVTRITTKKKILVQIFIILAFIISGVYVLKHYVFSCFDDTRKIGIYRSSPNIEFARKNGLLLNDIELSKNTIRLNDTLTLKIAESWIEIGWLYDCINNRIEIVKYPDIKKLLIELDNTSWSDYMDYNSIKLADKYGGSDNGIIVFQPYSSESNKLMVYQLIEKYKFNGDRILTDSIEIIY